MKSGGFNLDVYIKFIRPQAHIYLWCDPIRDFRSFFAWSQVNWAPNTSDVFIMSNEQNPLRLNGRKKNLCSSQRFI